MAEQTEVRRASTLCTKKQVVSLPHQHLVHSHDQTVESMQKPTRVAIRQPPLVDLYPMYPHPLEAGCYWWFYRRAPLEIIHAFLRAIVSTFFLRSSRQPRDKKIVDSLSPIMAKDTPKDTDTVLNMRLDYIYANRNIGIGIIYAKMNIGDTVLLTPISRRFGAG